MPIEYLRQIWRRRRRPIYELFGSDRWSHLALNDLDQKLKKHLDFENGTFIEAGANDGLSQSNTYWFERFRGWRGMLIEAVPDQAQRCRRNRPRAEVINVALVADPDLKTIRINAAHLMAFIPGSRQPQEEDARVRLAMDVQRLESVPQIEVPATTLEAILDRHTGGSIDFFSLDVEGYEIPVLRGMNPDRHRPGLILVETTQLDEVLAALKGYYRVIDKLSHHDYLLKTDSNI